MQKFIFAFFFELALADFASYAPRGWRPHGQSFNPSKNQLQSYGPPAASLTYGSSELTTRYPPFATTKPPQTTTTTTTTTSRSRKPTTATTPPPITEEDIGNNPALAIANSFAFNRPVYIYNTYPFSGFTVI
ncbi:probable serine/threonine-protein kinase irlC [Leptopilina boulardi]|uniref:probable serine/threonine-protein kinase irlC n=1 Tax=Leptopilina boulardi TaxID=63433 RepID=UPI0021F595F8|nr:probable serine/threonine-protein kinase irlC [Leptopilina boulardi]